MGTSYDEIRDKFYKMLKGDKRYFAYANLTEIEAMELANDHFLNLLEQSIEKIYSYPTPPQIDFYDKDDMMETFNVEINKKEIGLLTRLCYLFYFQEDKNKLHEFMKTFSSSELGMLSPANERRSVLEMINDMEYKLNAEIVSYLSADRTTGKIKSSQTQIELR